MRINTPNVKTMLDCQRMFDNIKHELDNSSSIDYGMWSFLGDNYGKITFNASVNDIVPNNYVLDEGSGGITTDGGFKYTLKKNKLYEFTSGIVFSGRTTASQLTLKWFNEDTESFFGGSSYTIDHAYAPPAATKSNNSTTKAFLKTTKDMKVSLRVFYANNVSYLYGENPITGFSYSWIAIREIK